MSSPANKSVSFPGGAHVLSRPSVTRRAAPGLFATVVHHGSLQELHLTLLPLAGETLAGMLHRLEQQLRANQAAIVKQDIFAPAPLHSETMGCLEQILGKPAWPVTWTDGRGCAENPIGGMHVTAVAGAPVEPVAHRGRIVGSIYQDPHIRHYVLGDLRPANAAGSRPDQTNQAYAELESVLALKKMSLFNVVRTWFYLDDILSWYDDFNVVRNTFYTERKLIERLVPASTGVGVKNPFEIAVVLGAWAMEPANGAMTLAMLPSPLQCPAPNYGSCFSRAIEIVTPGLRRVLVSGTASIRPDGASIHEADMQRQVELTMQVIESILATRKLSWADATRATAFIKCPQDTAVFAKWQQGCPSPLPATVVQADVCRPELLFELELDVIAPLP